jgi:hypothetical protein
MMRIQPEGSPRRPPARRSFRDAAALLLPFVAALSCHRGSDVGSRVRRLAIDASALQVVDGLDVVLTATAIEADGDRRDVTALVEWSSSAPAIASVVALPDGSRVARGHSVGDATLTARYPPTGVVATLLLSVQPAELVSIELTPTTASIAAGTSQPFVATGIWTDATTTNLTATVAWQSDAPAVAMMDATPGREGIADSFTPGTTLVTATAAGGMVGSATLEVTAATLVALEVTPGSAALPLGTTQAFVAIGHFSDSTTQDLTDAVDWSCDSPSVASIVAGPPGAGVATALAVGSATLSALHAGSGLDADASLDVTAAILQSLAVSPTLPSVPLGVDQSFLATGTYSDGTTQDLTALVDWESSDEGIATIADAPGTAGMATTLAVGATTISATFGGGFSDSTTLTVTSATLDALMLAPADPAIPNGTALEFTATGIFSDGSSADFTELVTWSSSDGGVATISNAAGVRGHAQTHGVGATTISAVDPASGESAATSLAVTAAALVSIAVTPDLPSLSLGLDLQMTATGTYSDASAQDLTQDVTWSSSAPGTATISNAGGSEGLASAQSLGAAILSATDPASSISGSTTLTVTAASLLSIAVTPADDSVATGATLAMAATGTFSDSSTADLTTQVTWSSSAPSIATLSNAGGSEGVATGVAIGTVTVTATEPSSGVNGQTSLSVTGDIEFIAAAAASAPTGITSLVIATPAGTIEGDLLTAAVAIRPSGATITPPSGWTLLRRSDNNSGATNSLALYTRVATAVEPADHTFVFSTTTGSAGGIAAFRGVDATTPIDVESAQATANGLNHATPSVNTTVADTMIITAHSMSSAATWTPPAGQTEIVDISSLAPPAATGICITLTCALQSAIGATGSKTATASNDSDTGNAAIVALRKAP